MTEYTKDDLRIIHQSLTRLTQPGAPRASTPEELVAIRPLLFKTTDMINEFRGKPERGARLLEWRLHPSVAPTANEISGMLARPRSKFVIVRAREELGEQIRKLVESTPGLDLCGAQRARIVRVTRFSNASANVDDEAIDQVGGKLPVDMLVKAGVFVNDSERWLVRECHKRQTRKGNLHVLVEIFEIAEYQIHAEGPADGLQPSDPFPPRRKKTKTPEGETPAPKRKPRTPKTAGMNTRNLPFGGT